MRTPSNGTFSCENCDWFTRTEPKRTVDEISAFGADTSTCPSCGNPTTFTPAT